MRDLDKHINILDKSKVENVKKVWFDSNGSIDETLNEKSASAVIIEGQKEHKYMVKANKSGRFYNPNKNDFNYHLEARDRLKDQPMFRFKTVNKNTFSQYISFLDKRYDSILIVAERSV